MTSRPHPSQGFTLIEVLVCLALMALVSMILVASLKLAGHAWQRVTRSAEAVDEVAECQTFLRTKLSSLAPASVIAEEPKSSSLQSDGQSVEFLGIAPAAYPGGIVRYRVAVSASGHSLEVTLIPEPFGAEANSSSSETLLTNVRSMTIRFYRKTDRQPGQWLDRWDSVEELPRLIRIDVALAESNSRRWPPLYIDPRADTPVTCQFDTVSHRCRVTT